MPEHSMLDLGKKSVEARPDLSVQPINHSRILQEAAAGVRRKNQIVELTSAAQAAQVKEAATAQQRQEILNKILLTNDITPEKQTLYSSSPQKHSPVTDLENAPPITINLTDASTTDSTTTTPSRLWGIATRLLSAGLNSTPNENLAEVALLAFTGSLNHDQLNQHVNSKTANSLVLGSNFIQVSQGSVRSNIAGLTPQDLTILASITPLQK